MPRLRSRVRASSPAPIQKGKQSLPFFIGLNHSAHKWLWRGSKAVMHRIANPCRSVRLRPAPPKLYLSDVDEDSTRKLSISRWQLSALDVRHNIAHIECAAGPQPTGQSSLADLTQYAAGLPPKSSGQLRLLARITPNQVQEPVPAEKAWLRRAPGPSWASALVCDHQALLRLARPPLAPCSTHSIRWVPN